MDFVINRHYVIRVPSVLTEIDEIHRRIRDKGTFDRDDLNAIVSYYQTVDPVSMMRYGHDIDNLYRLLDRLGRFKNIVPRPNSDYLDDVEWDHQFKQRGSENGNWYDPGILYGSASNSDSEGGEGYIYVNRFYADFGIAIAKGYEIEFTLPEERCTFMIELKG